MLGDEDKTNYLVSVKEVTLPVLLLGMETKVTLNLHCFEKGIYTK